MKRFVLCFALLTVLSGGQVGADLIYNPSLGTLPSSQGWTHFVDDPPPGDGLSESNYTLAGGSLMQGDTGGPNVDNFNLQSYESVGLAYDFATAQVTVFADLQIITSTLTHPNPPGPVSNRRAGWSIQVTDGAGRLVLLFVGESALFLLGKNEESTGPIPFDTTDAVHEYELLINSSGANLFVDNIQQASLAFNQFRLDGQAFANRMSIGDLTVNERSSSKLNGFRITVVPIPEPSTIILFGVGVLSILGIGWRRRKKEEGKRMLMKPHLLLYLAILGMVCGVHQAEAIPITNGLVGYWPADGTPNDSSGNNNHGTLVNGATFAAGIVGQAFSFDGVNDSVSVPKAANMNLASGSIATWILSTVNTETVDVFLSFADGSVNGSNALSMAILDTGQIRVLKAFNGAFTYVGTTVETFALNQWHHTTFTIDSSGNKLYVNGVQQSLSYDFGGASNTDFLDDIFSNIVSFDIGKSNIVNFQRHFSGRIDEVALYNRALSPSEVAANAAIPEPSTIALFGIGILGFLGMGWRRRRTT